MFGILRRIPSSLPPVSDGAVQVRLADVSGVRGVCIEIKNHAKMDLGGWLQELLVEIVNAKAETGAVVHKRKGKSDVGQWYATMTVDMWIYLLKEAGYGETKTTRQGLTD